MSRPTSSSINSKASKPSGPSAWSRPLPRSPPGLSSSANNNKTKNTNANVTANNTNTDKSNTNINAKTFNALRYRFLQLQLSLIGQTVTIHLQNGSIVQGVLHTFTPFNTSPARTVGPTGTSSSTSKNSKLFMEYKNHYVLKAVVIIKPPNNDKDKDIDNNTDMKQVMNHGSTVIIPSSKVIQLHAKSLRLENQQQSSQQNNNNNNNEEHDPFRTDTDISGGTTSSYSSKLVHAGNEWMSMGDTANHDSNLIGTLEDLSLEKNDNHTSTNNSVSMTRGGLFRSANSAAPNNNPSSSSTSWDQFKTNEIKFGIKATYDENLYTTTLDKSQIDTKKQIEAERLAREIEGTATTNIHLAEERGQVVQGDFDEEDLYSGVMLSTTTTGAGDKKGERKQLVLKPRSVDVTTAKATTDAAVTAKETSISAGMKDASASTMNKSTVTTKTTITTSVTTSKKMNYAAAAASGSTSTSDKKTIPTKTTSTTDRSDDSNTDNEKNPPTDTAKTDAATVATTTDTDTHAKTDATTAAAAINNDDNDEKADTKKEEKTKSKLNPNASKFVFNPSAAEWKPSFGGGGTTTSSNNTPPPQEPLPNQQHHHNNIHLQQQQQTPYFNYHHQQMQYPTAAMMYHQPYNMPPPRLNPMQYGMMPPMQSQQQQFNGVNMTTGQEQQLPQDGYGGNDGVSGGGVMNDSNDNNDPKSDSNNDNNNNEEEEGTTGENGTNNDVVGSGDMADESAIKGDSNESLQHSKQQQLQLPMGYNAGPNAYYQNNGMPMGHHGQYPHQMIGGPRQIPIQPGNPYYMSPMHQQNMSQYQMRNSFPNQGPYMPQQGYNNNGGGNIHLGTHGGVVMDEDGGGFRNNGNGGGGRGRGGGRGGGGRGGRGGRRNSTNRLSGGRYNNNNNGGNPYNYMNNSSYGGNNINNNSSGPHGAGTTGNEHSSNDADVQSNTNNTTEAS